MSPIYQMRRMRRVLEYDEDTMTRRCEPYASLPECYAHLRRRRLSQVGHAPSRKPCASRIRRRSSTDEVKLVYPRSLENRVRSIHDKHRSIKFATEPTNVRRAGGREIVMDFAWRWRGAQTGRHVADRLSDLLPGEWCVQ